MSKISLIIILLLQAGTSFAQKYFVFIGADNRQPFYVRVDSEFHSSSAEGHLILSQLKDSTYTITIGFPGQTLPEQHYAFSMHGQDQAFELRPQDLNGLRLYDLQGNSWLALQGGGGAGDDSRSKGVKKDDGFSRMMAGVVQDTAVLYNTYAMEQALSDSPAVATRQPAPTAPIPTQTLAPADTSAATPDTTAATPATAITAASTTITPPDSAANKPMDSTAGKPVDTPITATAANSTTANSTTANPTAIPVNPANQLATAPLTSPTNPMTTDSVGHTHPVDTTRSAGVVTHQPAPRFSDSGATPLYRPILKDSAASAAPIPSTMGAPLYRATGGVVKLSERHSPKNVRLVYADRSGSKKADTIVVIIPVDTPAVDKTAGRPPHAADSSHIPTTRAHGPNADSPTVSASGAYRPTIPPAQPTEASRPHPADTTRRPAKATPYVNSDCHDFASDFDVDKLRVRMLESGKDEDRITVARKTFKSKCFSTRQVRTLSEVFTSDAAKFRFFEAAWPFAADEHFHELSDLLADPVYNSKFKTMTHQQ